MTTEQKEMLRVLMDELSPKLNGYLRSIGKEKLMAQPMVEENPD